MSDVLPEGWSRQVLKSFIVEVVSGQSPNRKDRAAISGKYGILKTTAIDWGKYLPSKNQEVLDDFKVNVKHEVKSGDILITKAGPVHRVGVVTFVPDSPKKLLVSGKMTLLRVDSVHDGQFVSYALSYDYFQKPLKESTTGMASSQTNFTHETLLNLPLLVPNSLPEQQKISAILSSVDYAIDRTRAQIEKLKDLKTGMMQELLTKGIGHIEFKDSPVGRIPVEWDCVKMNTVAKVNDGAHHTPTYTSSGVPFLRVTDLKNKDILSGNIKYISSGEHKELIKRCKPEKGDILYSKNGTIGITRLIDWDAEFSIFVSLALIKVMSKSVLSEYLVLFMDSPIVHTQIKARSKQGTVTNLHLEEMRDFDIPLPGLKEQIKVAKIINAQILKLDMTRKKLTTLESVKKALMQDLLTGKVRVKIDDKESAVA